MRVSIARLAWVLTSLHITVAQDRTSPAAVSSKSTSGAANPSVTASATVPRSGSLSPSATALLSLAPSLSSVTLLANATSSSTVPLASPSLMANGTTLDVDGSLLYPNGSRTLTNGTLVLPNVTASSVLPYDVKLDGVYGVLGGVLIVSGAPVCILGGKNRWTSLFLLYFYAGAFITLVLAVHFGVSFPEDPPSATMRGVFVLIGFGVGALAGAVAVLVASWARYGLTFVGGWSVAWWILSFGQGGLINVLWGRWVLFAGLSTVTFVLGLHPRTHNPLSVLSTSFVGATAFVLGIDCYTRAGLKELYVWNLGFRSIFDDVLKPQGGVFRLGDVGIVEIALIGILWVVGFAIQFKAWDHLLRPLPALSRTERRARRESRALEAERRVTRHDDELDAWERAHGKGPHGLGVHGWAEKGLDSPSGSNAILKRADSGWGSVTESASAFQNGVAVPVFAQDTEADRRPALGSNLQVSAQKEALLSKTESIRRSIDALRSGSPESAPLTLPKVGHGLSSSAFTLSSESQTTTTTPTPVSFQPLPALSELGRSQPMPAFNSSQSGRMSDWDRYVEKRQIVQSPSSSAALDGFGRSDRPLTHSQSHHGNDLHTPIVQPLALSGSSAGRQGYARQPPSKRSGQVASDAVPPSSPPRRHGPKRSLSRDELADRHSHLLRKMQASATDSLEADRARKECEARQQTERNDHARKRDSMAALLANEPRRKSGNVDVEGWRGSIAVVENRARPPMIGPPDSHYASASSATNRY